MYIYLRKRAEQLYPYIKGHYIIRYLATANTLAAFISTIVHTSALV